MSSIRSLKLCAVFGIYLISMSNGFSTDASSEDEQSASREGNETISISQRMCQEYSKLSRPHVALGSREFQLNIHGEIDRCGITNTSTQSGEAAYGEIPHMALIGYEKDGEMEYICGGSIISERYILTAGYCAKTIANNSSITYFVRFGGLHLRNITDDATFQRIWVAEVILHPEFISGEVYNDIALVRLEKAIKMSWKVRPICLYTEESVNKLPLVASGWGRNPETGKQNELLRKVGLVETPYQVCKVPFDIRKEFGRVIKNGIDNETMICATHPLGHDGLCHGDGGGPLYVRSRESYCSYQLVGIIGFGGICKKIQEVPTVFTRVAPYVPWIESVVWQENTSSTFAEPLK